MKTNKLAALFISTALVIPGIIASTSNSADAKPTQHKVKNEIPTKPFYKQNLGNGRKVEVDSTGGGIRFQNGVRIGVERIQTGKPQIHRRGNATIVDTNPKNTGIGINYRF